MNELVIVTPEESHIDEETGEKVIDVEQVLNTKPATLAALKTAVSAKYPDCTITDYNVDAIVGTVGSYTKFKGCF